MKATFICVGLALILGYGSCALAAVASPVDNTSAPADAQGASVAKPGGDAPLIVMLTASMDTAINGKNAICVSNIMTLPGPHGWRVPTPDYSDSAYDAWRKANDAALATIDGYKEAFLEKCRAYGPARAGNSSYLYNREQDQVQQMQDLLQRQRDDGMPIVDMP